MVIKTGYFAQAEKYEQQGYITVSVASVTPVWYKGHVQSILAPPKHLVFDLKNKLISEEIFTERYLSYLKSLKLDNVFRSWEYLIKEYNAKGIVLICYEASSSFCHRHILAKYLNMGVEELEV